MKFATVTAVLLMITVCVLLPKLPAIHTWAVEREEERIAEAELADTNCPYRTATDRGELF